MEKNNLVEYFNDIGAVVVITKIFIKDLQSRRAILIEAMLQNGAMGFVIGSLIYDEVVYLIPIAIYALMQYCALLFYIGTIKIKN